MWSRAAISPPRIPLARFAGDTPVEAWLMLWGFVVLTLALGLLQPFPTGFDELQHLSYLRWMQEAPTLLPAQGAMTVLDLGGLGRWTGERNHLNHPSFYYLVLGAVTPADLGVLPLRALNVVLAGAAAALTIHAGCRLLSGRTERILFALAALSFPKAAVIGGTINNDNLAALAGAMLFAGLVGLTGGVWWIAAALAIAGWTKLNALIALGVAAGLWLLLTRERRLQNWAVIAAGAATGCVPTLLNLLTIGSLVWVDEARFFVAPAERPDLNLAGYGRFFFEMFAAKWAAAEYAAPAWLCFGLLLVPFGLAFLGSRSGKPRLLSAYGAAFGATLAVHFWFGWQSYLGIGDLSIAQPRYYAVLWPGLSVGIALGIARLWTVSRPAGAAGILALIWPTALGGIVVAAF